MSWRGGKSDWESAGDSTGRGGHSRNDSYRSSKQEDKWPRRGDEEGDYNRGDHHRGGRSFNSRAGDSGRYQRDERDYRAGDRGGGSKWKHDRYDDDTSHSREGRHSGRDDRWPSGGSWGNVNKNNERRDRSRSPRRDSHRGGGHRNRHDSYSQEQDSYNSRGYSGNQRGGQEANYGNSYGSQQGKWPEQQYDDSYGYHEPSATLKVSNVPEWLTADRIRGAIEAMDIGVRSCQMSGDWSGLGYIELGRVSDATYLVDECKGHLMVGDQSVYVEYADTSNIKAPQDPNYHSGHSYGNHSHNKNFPTEPTDTMIVRNLDLESTEESIRAAFQYITKKPILDIRLAKDKFTGNSRGFSFISWSSVDDCKQVLEYLQNATPKFKIDDRVVILDYANGLPGKTQDLKQQAANDAIAAATAIKTSWNDPNQLVGGAAALLKQTANQQGIAPHQTPHLYPKLPAEIGLKAPPLGMIPPIPPDQIPPQRDPSGRYRKYQNPDFSMFQWMANHQMYYDPRTGLMWCVKKMQFYNQYTQQYLNWDPTQDTFVPVDHISIDTSLDQPGTA